MTTTNEKTESFNKNYKLLQETVKTLRDQEEPDIDALIPMVERATKAYKVCKQRLTDVKSALAEHFTEEDKETADDQAE